VLLLEIAEASLSPDADMRRFFLRSFYRYEYACDASDRLTKQTRYNSGGTTKSCSYGNSVWRTFIRLGLSLQIRNVPVECLFDFQGS
jgi:hypothetical protein